MPSKKLTTRSIPTLSPGEWYDAVLPGLVLRVGKRRRVWQLRYRIGGRYRRDPLGHYPAMELGEARDAARGLIERIDSGAPPPPAVPHPRAVDVLTLDRLLGRYQAMRVREGSRIKTLSKTMRVLRAHLKPYLDLAAPAFSKADLREVRDRLINAGTPAAANQMLGAIGAVMQWASEEDLVESNFVPAIRRTPVQARQRVLATSEIKAIWRASEDLGPSDVAQSYGRLVRFLLLTAQRLDEAGSLRHGDILDGTWKQAQNKSSRPHSLPLPALALDLVGPGAARDLVFPGRISKIAALSKLKRLLDRKSGVTDWRIHDLRRTAASSMQDLGIRNEVVQAILNHAVPGVGGVYLRAELEKQKAEALATWATALTRIVGQGRVVA